MLLTLKEEYYAYKQAMDIYDHAQPGEGGEQAQAETKTEAAITAGQISNARSYITKNLDKVLGFQNSGDTAKAAEWRAKVSERVQLLLTAKAEITADTIAKLQQAGITVGEEQKPEETGDHEGNTDTASPETAQAE